MVRIFVGALVGTLVDAFVGAVVGVLVGAVAGELVGALVVIVIEGSLLGNNDGAIVIVGTPRGFLVGCVVG